MKQYLKIIKHALPNRGSKYTGLLLDENKRDYGSIDFDYFEQDTHLQAYFFYLNRRLYHTLHLRNDDIQNVEIIGDLKPKKVTTKEDHDRSLSL